MSWLHALILGLVQGCTEFFPISSSAHLKLVKQGLQIPSGEETLFFDLACHLGTLLALVIYFRKDLWDLCFVQPKKLVLYFVALLPLVPVYFLLKPLRLWASQPHFLGICLMITALMLFIIPLISKRGIHRDEKNQSPSWKDAVWIGTLQSVALVPGISRSASTITAGLWRGLSARKAVRFSFLLSIPAVAGGAVLESLKLFQHSALTLDPISCSIGFAVAAGVGLGMASLAIPLLEKGFFRPFAWYCLIVSILLIL